MTDGERIELKVYQEFVKIGNDKEKEFVLERLP
jgi:hypothetical protein